MIISKTDFREFEKKQKQKSERRIVFDFYIEMEEITAVLRNSMIFQGRKNVTTVLNHQQNNRINLRKTFSYVSYLLINY